MSTRVQSRLGTLLVEPCAAVRVSARRCRPLRGSLTVLLAVLGLRDLARAFIARTPRLGL